jgi:hypothetical protein
MLVAISCFSQDDEHEKFATKPENPYQYEVFFKKNVNDGINVGVLSIKCQYILDQDGSLVDENTKLNVVSELQIVSRYVQYDGKVIENIITLPIEIIKYVRKIATFNRT